MGRRPRSLFGEMLRRELETQGVSQRELARRLTLQQPERLENMRRSLIRYIHGEVIPTTSAREAIADALAVDPTVFDDSPRSTRSREIIEDAVENLVDALMLAVTLAHDDERTEAKA